MNIIYNRKTYLLLSNIYYTKVFVMLHYLNYFESHKTSNTSLQVEMNFTLKNSN